MTGLTRRRLLVLIIRNEGNAFCFFKNHTSKKHYCPDGGGNAFWQAKQYVQLHGLQKQVRFYGQISHAEMLRQVPHYQLSVTVSYGFDTQGMTLLEAAAGGLPVFFCDPDMREVVPRAGAICADDPTPTAMAAALQGLLAHPERIAAMSAAMLKFRPQVAESVQIDQMLKAYRRLCG